MEMRRILKVVVQSPRQVVGRGPSARWEWTETTIDALHVEATMTRSRRWNDNEMNLNVYNMSKDTSASIFCKGAVVRVYAGYEGAGVGLMFQGNVLTHRRTSNGTDTMDMVYAMCLRGVKDSTFGATPVSFGYGNAVSLATIYERIATTLGLVPYGTESIRAFKLDDYYFAGTIGQVMDDLEPLLNSCGFGVARDLGAMVVYALDGGDSTYAVAHLDFTDGLLSVRDCTDYAGQAKERLTDIEEQGLTIMADDGSEDVLKEMETIYTTARKEYTAQTIIIPKLKPNALVDVQTDEVRGQFVVDEMEIAVGNLPDSRFNMELRLLEVADPKELRGVVTYTIDEVRRGKDKGKTKITHGKAQ